MQPPLLANVLNPEVILAAQIVLALFAPIITLLAFPRLFAPIITLLAFPRFQRVKLVLELISEAVWTLFRIVGLFQRLIRDLHQIISMAHDGFPVVSFLELIVDVVGSLVNLVDKLKRLIRTCRGIWNIWTAQPSANANDGHNDIIVNEESTT